MARDYWNGDDPEYDEFYDKHYDDESLRQDLLTDIIEDRKKLMSLLEDTDYFLCLLDDKISSLFHEKGFNE
tara:strand:+ start:233 stop:445 length:213 start_codon:yes stop_codon:yes gene_type:complete